MEVNTPLQGEVLFGLHLRQKGDLLPPFHSRLPPSCSGHYGASLAPSLCSSPAPKVLVPFFPLFTNYLWTVVLFFCSMFIRRHPPLLLLPAPTFILPFVFFFFLPALLPKTL